MNLLTDQQKVEFKPIAKYAERLPGGELGKLWGKIRASISPDIAINTEIYWQLLGIHLEAFFNDHPDPIENVLEVDWQKEYIRTYGNYYIQLSVLIFQAEHLIKNECNERNIEYPFKKRSDLIQTLMLEDCLQEICKPLSEFYESPSAKQMKEYASLLINIGEDKVQIGAKICRASDHPNKATASLEKLRKHLKKLTRIDYQPEHFSFWNDLCREIFWRNQSRLPAFTGYWASIKQILNFWHSPHSPGYGLFKKHAYDQGKYQESKLSRISKRKIS